MEAGLYMCKNWQSVPVRAVQMPADGKRGIRLSAEQTAQLLSVSVDGALKPTAGQAAALEPTPHACVRILARPVTSEKPPNCGALVASSVKQEQLVSPLGGVPFLSGELTSNICRRGQERGLMEE